MYMKKSNTNEFINKAKHVHKNKYDYSLVDYNGSFVKIKIICPIHGIFEQRPNLHLQGNKCPMCIYDNYRKSLNNFISQSNKIHNDKYDYSLVNYKNNNSKVKIMCPNHGVFEQSPNSHLRGSGCPVCANNIKFTKDDFINKSEIIHHKKYDYSLVDYKGTFSKVKIICLIHGTFEQTPNNHLHNQGCPICANNIKSTNADFIKKSNITHNSRYDYSLIDYKNNRTKVKIICPIHGTFEQDPYSHIKGCGCPICKESKGEREIRNFLLKNNIDFIRQKTFGDCRYKKLLPFDFYLSEHNICIEYDGEQHYTPIFKFGGNNKYEKIVIKDNIRNIYCRKNNIYLLRITYKDDIQEKMNNLLRKIKMKNMIIKKYNQLNEETIGKKMIKGFNDFLNEKKLDKMTNNELRKHVMNNFEATPKNLEKLVEVTKDYTIPELMSISYSLGISAGALYCNLMKKNHDIVIPI